MHNTSASVLDVNPAQDVAETQKLSSEGRQSLLRDIVYFDHPFATPRRCHERVFRPDLRQGHGDEEAGNDRREL